MNQRLTDAGFAPKDESAFVKGNGLESVDTIVVLNNGTCTHRAGQMWLEAHEQSFHMLPVSTFEQAIQKIRDDMHAVILVPGLHDIQKRLDSKHHYQRLDSQQFTLPNPGLHVATPIRTSSDRTYLWTLPTLLQLVREQYGEILPFEEVIPQESTRAAAHYCSRIYGGGFCVTNDDGLRDFELRSVRTLRHIMMEWFLYRKRPKGE